MPESRYFAGSGRYLGSGLPVDPDGRGIDADGAEPDGVAEVAAKCRMFL
jgi:hypothetical protein